MLGQLYYFVQQPHAGQLRYHDFTKLREIEQNRSLNRQKKQQQLLSSITKENVRHFHTLNNINKKKYNSSLWHFGTKYVEETNSCHHPVISLPNGTKIMVRSFFNKTGGSSGSTTPPSFMTNIALKALERNANNNPDDPNIQYTFVSELVKYYPQVAIQRLTNPEFRHLAMDGKTALLLLQTVMYTNSYHSLDTIQLLNRLGKSHTNISKEALIQLKDQFKMGGRMISKEQQVQQLQHLLTTGTLPPPIHGGGGGGGGIPGGGAAAAAAMGSTATNAWNAGGLSAGPIRGADPKYPLHVQMHQPGSSARSAVLGIAGRVLLVFVVVSAVGAMLDDKGVGRSLGMNNSSKHIQEADQPVNVKFEDVKGVEEAKAELEEIVQYLKDPSRFTRLGGKLPRGVLLTGPPGTGKTMLAKAIAGEADVPFFFSSGSQFEEVYVGLGAKRVRELFEAAKKKAPAIIFIDEIDAIGGTRKLKDQSALKMTLNELLVQLDGFDENNGIIVIGATNFMESLDDALLRPGRFDKHVTVPLPDVGGRKEILQMYAKKTKLAKDVDLTILARGTTGFSGADLYNLMNQAAVKASVDGLNAISMSVLEYAKDKIMMGAERRTAVITPETAKCTAYHEAGHALVATLTDGAHPIHKATIMPRGSALGMVTMLPEGDQVSQSLKEMHAFMDVAMGGRVAEELIFGREEATSGAMSDIANATKVARNMVTKYGFSEDIGLVFYGGHTGEESASDETRAKIDREVKRLTDASYQRVKNLLLKHKQAHHLLAKTLLEYETLTGEEVRDIVLKGTKPGRPIINHDGGRRGDPTLMLNNKGSASKPTSSSGGKKSILSSERER